MAVGNMYSMQKYLNMYSTIQSILKSQTFHNPETILETYLRNQEIRLIKLDFDFNLNPNRNDEKCTVRYKK